MKTPLLAFLLLATSSPLFFAKADNPVFPGVYTADPTALVHGDTAYIYCGHDTAPEGTERYIMGEWLCFSSTDMVHWTPQGSPASLKTFAWAQSDAWACDVKEKGGKFYMYCPVQAQGERTFSIGVAVSDSPTGPFTDARGTPLVTHAMLPSPPHDWSDIDPAAFVDDDGQAYLFWGNTTAYWAKLKPNMTELDGDVHVIDLSACDPYTEAPFVHKRNGTYYLSYATGFPEKTAYAMAKNINGPWTKGGLLAEGAGNSNTIHQAIIQFKGQWYFVYHDGMLPGGTSFHRSVCVDYLYYNPDGTMKRVIQTTEGTTLPPQAP